MENSVAPQPDFVLEVAVDNKTTYYYAFKEPSVMLTDSEGDSSTVYDQQGAMYFAVAVILMYGVSIALLIGSTLRKKENSDYDVKSFLRGYAKLDRQEKKRVKQKTRMTLLERNLLPMFPGCSLAATPSFFQKRQVPGESKAGPSGATAGDLEPSPTPGSTEVTVTPVTPNTDEFSIYFEPDEEDPVYVYGSDPESGGRRAVTFDKQI